MQHVIDGKTYTIGRLPAGQAIKAALVIAKWQGRLLQKLAPLAANRDDTEAQAHGAGVMVEHRASMLLDSEYTEHVWLPLLGICMLDGHPVTQTMDAAFAGASLPTLLALHDAAKESSCGPFVAGLGKMA
jgi:hypothetical protein